MLKKLVSLVGVLLLSYLITGCGNKGYDTKCGDFVNLSASRKRAVVVKEIGEHSQITTVPRAVEQISKDCALSVKQNSPDTTINESN